MKFKEIEVPGGNKAWVPEDLNLAFPKESQLPVEDQHFLAYIPWDKKYLENVPLGFRDFFMHVLPHLHARTTDVHEAICMGFLDEMIGQFPGQKIDRRVVGLSLILHDSGWSKLNEKEIAASLGVTGLTLTAGAMGPKERHAVEGEKLAEKLLGNFKFDLPLSREDQLLIRRGVLYHDKPWEVAGANMPLEIQLLVDLDHMWSFTYQNFWQDVVRKGVRPQVYYENLKVDLDDYFVTEPGKRKARALLEERKQEIGLLNLQLS